jgi:nucleoid-associated protein YgaU
MPNDAKLGLALGVALVIVVAALFARKDLGAVPVHAAGTVLAPSPVPLPSPVPGTTQPAGVAAGTEREGRTHTVQEGETLTSLAQRYYGDRSRSLHLYHANRDLLMAPDRLPAGVVLRIPELPECEDRER